MAILEVPMGDKKPKKTSSGNHDKHAAKNTKSQFILPDAPAAPKADEKKKGKK
jgi:hypothetical protein